MSDPEDLFCTCGHNYEEHTTGHCWNNDNGKWCECKGFESDED